MTLSASVTRSIDLRVEPIDAALEHVEQSFRVRLDRDTVVRKRRSVGARTDRDTWVRIERRGLDKIGVQGWNGTECASRLEGIAQPAWHGCVVWRDADQPVMWRADETDLLPGTPIGTAVLSEAPTLPDDWWRAFNASLDALAAQDTSRVATPDTVPITQAMVTESIRSLFSGDFDTTVEHGLPAHADLNWANMTAPKFCLFDWEDWGRAPRGLDSAALWGSSLAVPALANRMRHERRRDLESRDGQLMTLFVCSKILEPGAHPEDPRLGPARRMAEQVVAELQADGQEAAMPLLFIGIDPNTGDHESPTVWVDQENKELVLQGWKPDGALEAECAAFELPGHAKGIPENEAVIRIPARMVSVIREACDAVERANGVH